MEFKDPHFDVRSGIPIPPKRRQPKYDWDAELIDEVVALRRTDPTRSLNAAIMDVLEDCLTPNELPYIKSHSRRIYNRINLLKLNNEF